MPEEVIVIAPFMVGCGAQRFSSHSAEMLAA
jgi:hypothetical protein